MVFRVPDCELGGRVGAVQTVDYGNRIIKDSKGYDTVEAWKQIDFCTGELPHIALIGKSGDSDHRG